MGLNGNIIRISELAVIVAALCRLKTSLHMFSKDSRNVSMFGMVMELDGTWPRPIFYNGQLPSFGSVGGIRLLS